VCRPNVVVMILRFQSTLFESDVGTFLIENRNEQFENDTSEAPEPGILILQTVLDVKLEPCKSLEEKSVMKTVLDLLSRCLEVR